MSAPLKSILIVGAGGRMGRAIARLVAEGATPGFRIAAALDHPDSGTIGTPAAEGVHITADWAEALATRPDVAVDFSFRAAIPTTAAALADARVPWVAGTTGLDAAGQAALAAAAERIAVVSSANMSLGINLLHALVEQAARALRGRGYDCEIIERHHRRKKDAPSGTALFLGDAAAKGYGWKLADVARDGRSGIPGERPEEEIGFHAIRGGDIVGDHTVLFAADGECLELSHRATSRDTLARGALRAATWLAESPSRAPGLYSMRDVLHLDEANR